MKRPLSIPTKAMGMTVLVLTLVGATQWFGLRAWIARTRPDVVRAFAMGSEARSVEVGMIAVVAIPYVVAIAVAGIWAGSLVRRRTARLTDALRKIGEGDLHVAFEPSIDSDLTVVRESLESMRHSLATLTARLRHVDAQRRRLFADLFHELATPVSTVLAVADALGQPAMCKTDDDRARLVRALSGEAARLERLIADVRELAYLDDPDVALVPETVNLAEVAQRVVDRLGATGSNEARIELSLANAAADVDAQRIEQVLMNLLRNARRHTPATGSIDIRVERDGADAIITVADSGEGVPDDKIAMLGERLFRLDASRDRASGGHGLGLSIVNAIVHRHGGTVSFARAALGGLAVTVRLPSSGAALSRE